MLSTSVSFCASFFIAALMSAGAQPDASASDGTEIVQTRLCTLRLDRRSGDLIGLTWKDPAVEVIREARLGENFRILLPEPDYEANYFHSKEQHCSRIEKTPDGVTCFYDSLRNGRATVDVKVQYNIRVVRDHLEFSIKVANPTSLPVAEVYFGIIGGQQGLVNRLDTESLVPGVNTNLAPGIFSSFVGGGYGGGNLGIRYSAAGFSYPRFYGAPGMAMSWMEFYNRKADVGLYYANHDVVSRLSTLYFELRPFSKTAVIGDTWPTPADVPAGEPIGLTMGWVNYPYTKNGTFRSGPVVLQVHRGDWHEGSKLYRAWFDQHFQVRRPPSWLRKEMAWQSVVISSPEDVIIYKFKDLPKLAADAKKYGVTTLEILGWQIGGLDRGYPQYTPDPRLGTPEEFRRALAEIKRMGVHPIIMTNIQFADTATSLFKDKLHRYTVRGRWADDLPLWAWGEGTIGARKGLTSHNMTLISPSHPEVRKLLLDQFTKLVKDGAECLQMDKANIVGRLDFNPALNTSPDRSLIEGQLAMFKDILREGRKVNPEFALAAECWWDRAFPLIDVSYMRMTRIDMHSPALRFTFPEWMATICAEGPGDFNVMNNGMRYGLVWAVQPRHYNDSMDEPLTRPLSEYVRELIRIRAKHKKLLFHGRFCDTLGASVKAGSDVRYSVFEGMEKPGKACVVVNFGNREETAEVTWPGGAGRQVEILRPFQQDVVEKLPVRVRLAPRTCAVIVQK